MIHWYKSFVREKKIKYFNVSVKDNINITISMNYLINLLTNKNSINDEIIEYHTININEELLENYDNKNNNLKINKESNSSNSNNSNNSNYSNYCYC